MIHPGNRNELASIPAIVYHASVTFPHPVTELSFPHIQRLGASAGSGKTHALTLRFLQLYLSSHVRSGSLPGLLAVTFTNKAANEMKDRIIQWLKDFYFQQDKDQIHAFLETCDIRKEALSDTARAKLEEIFSNWHDFSVRTIDSFFVGLAHGASFELGVSPGADIIMESRPVIKEAVRDLLDMVGQDRAVTRLFERVVLDIMVLKDDVGWDILREITGIIETLRSIETSKGKHFVSRRSERKTIQRQMERARKNAGDILGWIEEGALSFATNSRIPERLFEFHKNGRTEEIAGSTLFQKPLLEAVMKSSQANVDETMEVSWSDLKANMDRYAFLLSREMFRPYLGLKVRVEKEIERIVNHRWALLLDSLMIRFRNYFREKSGVLDIYFYWGERLNHFLLDEFQDTSISQWESLFPLLEEALSRGGSMFLVGDPKQAIYRFRGGNVDLFHESVRQFPMVAESGKYDDTLPCNYRSGRPLVEFYNRIFSRDNLMDWFESEVNRHKLFNSEDFDRWIAKPYENARQQCRSEQGLLRIRPIHFPEDKSIREGKIEIIRMIMETTLTTLLDRYDPGDIAFLVRKNSEAILVSQALMDRGYPVASQVTTHTGSSFLVREIMSFLAFLESPLDDIAFSAFVTGNMLQSAISLSSQTIFELFVDMENRSIPFYIRFREHYPDIWDRWIEPFFSKAGHLPLYDLYQTMIDTFDLHSRFGNEDLFICQLLEIIKTCEADGISTIGDFLVFWEENGDEPLMQVPLPDRADAIRVMTVHRAKGLGFPVVILPFPYLSLLPPSYTIREEKNQLVPYRQFGQLDKLSESLRGMKNLEKILCIQDELNAFYVSVTRAREELYLFYPEFGSRRWKNKMKVPIPVSLQDIEIQGKEENKKVQVIKPYRQTIQPLYGLRQYPWQQRIIRRKKPFLTPGTPEQKEAVRRGTIIHRVLEEVKDKGTDLDPLIARSGCDRTEQTRIRTMIRELMEHPDTSFLFDPDPETVVEQEVELVDEKGHLYRVDRIVRKKDRIQVVEFKTGPEVPEEHDEQVRTYLNLLKKIYPGYSVHGILCYVNPPRIQEIT